MMLILPSWQHTVWYFSLYQLVPVGLEECSILERTRFGAISRIVRELAASEDDLVRKDFSKESSAYSISPHPLQVDCVI